MAASQEQKVDYLLKKIGYVSSKTGIAEDSSLSGTKKAPFAESIPSPLVTPSDSIWADSSFIPTTPPNSNTSYVEVYSTGSPFRMTFDNTVAGNRAFIARSTHGDQSSSVEGDWIDTSFGSDYIINVYKGDPGSGGVKLSASGSGSNDTWFFDYSSGVLNFNGTVVPTGITTNNIYLVGYRYIGAKGIKPPAGIATFNDLNVSGITTLGTVQISSGIITATSGVVTYYGDGSNLTGIATDSDKLDGQQGSYYLDYANFSGIATDADKLDGQQGSYYLDYANFNNTPTIPTVNNATLSLETSGDGISGSDTFTANQSTDTTFTVTVSSASTNQANTLVYRDASGGFSAGIITANALKGLDYLQAPYGNTVNYSVTVASKTAAHRYYGTGSNNGYLIDGIESPFLTLTPGRTYRFDQSDISNSGHPLRFHLEADGNPLYSTGVTNAGTPGLPGAYTQIVISDTTPTILHYQCTVHAYMGNSVQTNSSIPVGNGSNLTDVDADKLDGQQGTYYLDYANFTGIATDSDKLDGQQGSYYLDYSNFVGIATDSDKLDGQQGSYYLDYANFVGIATDADKLDGQEGTYYLNYSNFVGLATDADKLDGQQGSYYLDYANFVGIATDADKLDGQQGSYYLDYANFTGIATDADKLDGQQGSYYLDYANFVGIATDADKLDGQQGSYYLNYSNFVGIATDSDKLDGQQGSYYLDYANFVGVATDADKLDGIQASSFLRSDANDTKTGVTTFSDVSVFGSNILPDSDNNEGPISGPVNPNGNGKDIGFRKFLFANAGAANTTILEGVDTTGVRVGMAITEDSGILQNSTTITSVSGSTVGISKTTLGSWQNNYTFTVDQKWNNAFFGGNIVSLGGIYMPEDAHIRLGGSPSSSGYATGKLRIYNDGTQNWFHSNGHDTKFLGSFVFCGDLNGTSQSAEFGGLENKSILKYNNATKLETTSSGIDITGIVTATSGVVTYYGDGTNLDLTDSVALGGDTTGDYVASISGTANQIAVDATSGEGTTPVISIPTNPTLPGTTVTIQNDLQVNRHLNVTGNITVGGTSGTLFTETLQVADADLILGVRTDANGNDVSTDTTASHGGIAIASTEGTPLVTLVNPGAGETLPATYKKIMWFEQGAFAGLGTDAWLINYGVGIGSTQVPNNVVLAAGDVHVTNNDIKKVRDINASGIITATTFSGSGASLTNIPTSSLVGLATDADKLDGIQASSFLRSDVADIKTSGSLTLDSGVKLELGSAEGELYYNNTDVLFYSSIPDIRIGAKTGDTVFGYGSGAGTTIAKFNNAGSVELNYATSKKFETKTDGIAVSGIVTAISGIVTYYGDGSNLTGISAGISTDAQLLDGLDSTQFLRSDAADTKTSGDLTFNDNVKLNLGSGGQQDSSIYHDGTDAIFSSRNGDIILHTIDTGEGGSGDDIIIKAGTGKTSIFAHNNGAVELWNNGSKKFETTSGGIAVSGIVTAISGVVTYYGDGSNLTGISAGISTDAQLLDGLDSTQFLRSDTADIKTSGDLTLSDNVNLNLGDNSDAKFVSIGNTVQLYSLTGKRWEHWSRGGTFNFGYGGGSYGTDRLVINNSSSGSGVELYYGDSSSSTKRLETTNNGIAISGIVTAISGVVTYYGDGSNLTNVDAATLDGVDSTSFLRSDAADTKTSGNLTFNDNISAVFGTSGDMTIRHDGTDNHITSGFDKDLNIEVSPDGGTPKIYIRPTTSHQGITLGGGSGNPVELYHNNAKKFETTGVGVTITGDLIVSNDARVSGVLTVGQSSVTIDGTDNSIHGYDVLIAPPKRDSTVTITVTVATKTSAHRYYDSGSTNGYVLNGIEAPFLTLTPGRTYKFDQSDSSNSGHPLRFYRDVDKNTLYSTGVTNAGTPGNSGAYTEIVVSDTTPTILHYQCTAHVKMGNSLQTNSEGSSTDASAGTYGDARYSPQITVDASGRITNISTVEIFSTGLGSDLDLNSNDITGTGNVNITGAVTASGNINANGNIVGDNSTNISGINSVTASTFYGSAANMTGTTGVGGGTYGSSSAIPVITVDANGRITSISPVTASGGGGGGGGGSAGVTRTVTSFTATNGQTTFNVNYTVGTIDVFVNGVRLNDAEFTATTGTTVVLATGASVGDIIDVAAYSSALGIEIKNNGTLVGTATTIDFSTDLTATFSGGTATVVSTASGGGGGGGVSEALAIAYAVAL